MIAAGGFQIPTHDPFDHSKCGHPQPVFPVEISSELTVDLINVLHVIWLGIVKLDLQDLLDFVDDLGRWVEMAAMGMADEVDGEVLRTKATAKDFHTLHDSAAFDAEFEQMVADMKPKDGDGNTN